MHDDVERRLREVAVEAGRSGRLASASAVRARGDQRRRRHAVGVTALSVVLLGAATAGVVISQERRDTTLPPAVQISSPSPAPSTPDVRRWASSTQFMEIQGGQVRNGQVYLQVRPAKKEILGEGFETITVPGPYIEVVLTADARIRYVDGAMDTPEVFVDELARRVSVRPNNVQPDQRKEGFDLTFDSESRVTQVNWLYVP